MIKLGAKWLKGKTPLTIWSRGAADLIPERYRRIVTFVLPLVYLLLFLFGAFACVVPVPTFALLVGNFYGSLWALLVAIMAALSFIGLAFRRRIEIYSSIMLTILLAVYPFYVAYIVFFTPGDDTPIMLTNIFGFSVAQNYTRLAVIFSVGIYPLLPGWRVFDIVFEIRKARQRELYAEASLGET